MEDPACMEPEELELWRVQAQYMRKQWTPNTTLDPCADCIVSFSVEMRAIGRCNGTPGEARPVPSEREVTEGRREANRRTQRRFRERNPRRAFGGALG